AAATAVANLATLPDVPTPLQFPISSERAVDVTWNGSAYVVAWQDGVPPRLWARRVSSAGAFLDAAPVPVSDASDGLARTSLAIASNGTVTFLAHKHGTEDRIIRLDATAQPIDALGSYYKPAGDPLSRAIGWSGTEFYFE